MLAGNILPALLIATVFAVVLALACYVVVTMGHNLRRGGRSTEARANYLRKLYAGAGRITWRRK